MREQIKKNYISVTVSWPLHGQDDERRIEVFKIVIIYFLLVTNNILYRSR